MGKSPNLSISGFCDIWQVFACIPYLPLQFNCADMQISRLKQEFGKDLVLWGGGCDTQQLLPYGTPEQVKEQVKKHVDILAPGGGFVFQQVHNILADVPPENIMAMFEAVRS